jgi:hypothetical protein
MTHSSKQKVSPSLDAGGRCIIHGLEPADNLAMRFLPTFVSRRDRTLIALAICASACGAPAAPPATATEPAPPFLIESGRVGDFDRSVPATLEAITARAKGHEVRAWEQTGEGNDFREFIIYEGQREMFHLVPDDQRQIEMAVIMTAGPKTSRGIEVGVTYDRVARAYSDLSCQRVTTTSDPDYGTIDLVSCKTGALGDVEFNFDIRSRNFPGTALPERSRLRDVALSNITVPFPAIRPL